MSSILTFDTLKDARAFLENVRFGRERFVFFRGEAQNYALSTPTLYREATLKLKKDIHNYEHDTYFLQNLFVDLLATHIVEKMYGEKDLQPSDYLKLDEAKHWEDYFCGSHTSASHLRNQIVCLLQHYGWKTNYLDLTKDIDVAIFFANYDFATSRVLEDGFAYVHYFDLEEGLKDGITKYPIYELKYIANLFCDLYKIRENRPMNQNGFSIKLLFKEGVDWLNAQKKTIRIRRSPTTTVHNRNYIYPLDSLYFYLKAQELNYFFYMMCNIEEISEPLKSYIIAKGEDFTFNKDSIK